jgi:hypothetical protein
VGVLLEMIELIRSTLVPVRGPSATDRAIEHGHPPARGKHGERDHRASVVTLSASGRRATREFEENIG